jgi:hypothetical protein
MPNDQDIDLDEDLACAAGQRRADRRNLFREFGGESFAAALERACGEARPLDLPARINPVRRKPSIAKMVKQVEKAGKEVTSVTRDGVTLNFGEPAPTEANNPWLADIAKATK